MRKTKMFWFGENIKQISEEETTFGIMQYKVQGTRYQVHGSFVSCFDEVFLGLKWG
jgi:hypothetical protein